MATITETAFSDIYITPKKQAFIPDKQTANALMKFEPEDFDKFYHLLEISWDVIIVWKELLLLMEFNTVQEKCQRKFLLLHLWDILNN